MAQTLTIYGYGKMARAIALGLNGRFPLEITGRNQEKILAFIEENHLHAVYVPLKELSLANRHIILCIKPHALRECVSKNCSLIPLESTQSAEAIYSILAGVSIEELRRAIPSKGYVRAMPNIAAELHASSTALYGDDSLKEFALTIFSTLGDALWLNRESKLNIATALAGGGPAYLALVAEALIDAGVREGLSRDESVSLTCTLFSGFSALLQSRHPALIKEQVASPAGTTFEALALLERAGIRGSFIDAVHAATLKSREH